MKPKDISIIKRRTQYIVGDYIMTSLAFFVFNIIRYIILFKHDIEGIKFYILSEKLLLEQVLVPIGLMIVYAISGYYNRPFPKSRLHEFFTTLYTAMVNAAIIFMIFLINDQTPKRRTEYLLIFLLFFILFISTYSIRLLITTISLNKFKKQARPYVTIIVGNSKKSREAYKSLRKNKSIYNYKFIGFVPLEGENDIRDGKPTIKESDLRRICIEKSVDQIIIAPQSRDNNIVMSILHRLFDLDIPIKIAPDTLSFVTAGIKLTDIMAEPFIDLTHPKLSDFSQNIKRSFDIVVSLLALTILSPFMLIVMLIIKNTSHGPIIYSQERIGKRRKPFRIYKFRSMYIDAEQNGPQLSSSEDNRITKFGKFMRKYRIDELPQFYNVLRGDMSIVGPRPERECFISEIIKQAPYYSLVYQVKPGITSWGMVKFGYASNIKQMVERTRYDMVYISNMSLQLDLKIMIYTVKTIVKGSGL